MSTYYDKDLYDFNVYLKILTEAFKKNYFIYIYHLNANKLPPVSDPDLVKHILREIQEILLKTKELNLMKVIYNLRIKFIDDLKQRDQRIRLNGQLYFTNIVVIYVVVTSNR